MLIGYLLLSPPLDHESGLVRYGRYLAQAVQQQPGIETREMVLELNDHKDFSRDLRQAVKRMGDCDVLHVQYSKYIGLTGWKKLKLLKLIRQLFKGQLCITLHDVYSDLYPAYSLQQAWQFENGRLRGFSNNQSLALRSTVTCLWQNHLADKAIMQWILSHGDQLLVCNQTEADRLQHFSGAEKITLIPHFVESRSRTLPPAKAKAALGFGDEIIITLQGFIYRSKGHSLLLNALSLLPENCKVIFAGGMAPNQDSFKRELKAQIQSLGLGERVKITGYLEEEELELYLAATDLAVCPFRIVSASGSLSTWISMERPILAYALPQIEELNDLVPGAISMFQDYSPDALAKSIQIFLADELQKTAAASASPLQQLKERLSLTRIAQEHIALYGGEETLPPPPLQEECLSSKP